MLPVGKWICSTESIVDIVSIEDVSHDDTNPLCGFCSNIVTIINAGVTIGRLATGV